MKRMTLIAALLALISVPVAAHEDPPLTGSDLLILPAGVRQYTEYRVNTGRKAVLADGTYNDVYTMKRPASGNVFLSVSLNLATDGEVRLSTQDIRLVDTTVKGLRTYSPFDWYIDLGLTQERGDVLTFTDKAALDALFEIPVRKLETLVLFIGDQRVGTVAEVTRRSPELL